MPADSESFGTPHTLTVYYDGDELTYDLEHPPSCTKRVYRYEFAALDGSEPVVEEWDCDIAWHEGEVGMFGALESSGTPVTGPGIYRIQGWSRKTYYPGVGYEHDAGMAVIGGGDDGDLPALGRTPRLRPQ